MRAHPRTVVLTSTLGLLLGAALGAAGGALATDHEVQVPQSIPILIDSVEVPDVRFDMGWGCKRPLRPDSATVDGASYRAQYLADGRIEVAATQPDGGLSYRIFGDRETFDSVWPQLEPAPVAVEVADEIALDLGLVIDPIGTPSPFGVAFGGVDALLRAQLGLADDEGVPALEVQEGSVAASIGVARYDVIVAVNGQRVASGEQVASLWTETAPGQAIRVVVIRGGRPVVLAGERASD